MNAFAYRKIITPRRLRIQYVSPGICEGDFSSTGRQEISLLPLLIPKGPTGLIQEIRFGKYRLQWNRIPGALCYSIYRLSDELDPNSPFILVAECIPDNWWETTVGGTYCVTAITPEGETECSNTAVVSTDPPPAPPPPTPDPDPLPDAPTPDPPPDIPGTCGDGSPVVPETFLVELDEPEILAEATAHGDTAGSADFTMVAGKIAAQWISGYVWDDCTIKVPPTPIKDAFVTNAWLVYDGDITLVGSSFGCYSPSGTPLDCTPALADQVNTEFPDSGIMNHPTVGCGTCQPQVLTPTDIRVGQTWTFTVPGSPQAGACPSGGAQTMRCLRTHVFIDQPTSLTIQNYASIKDVLCCVTGADAGPQWNGVIDDACTILTAGYQCAETNNGEYAGNVAIVFVDVRFVAGEKWTISIIGEIDGSYVQLFSGEKRYGQTARGNYGRNGGCSTLGCVTLI